VRDIAETDLHKGEAPMPKIIRTSVAVGFALSTAGLAAFSSWPAEAQQSRSERSYYSQSAASNRAARQTNSQQGSSVYWNGCCGPASIKMGTDPDPFIRSQILRDASGFFGGGDN
jgi:hypothetical protein